MIDAQVFSRWHYFGINDEPDAGIKLDVVDCGPLPGELFDFEGRCEKENVELHWSTASETNSDHFILERSSSGSDWSFVACIEAARQSMQVTAYRAIDPMANSSGATVYYRLWQYDLDGNGTNLKIVAVPTCVHGDLGTITVQPNPATGSTMVMHTGRRIEGSALLVVRDASGRLLRRTAWEDTTPGRVFVLDLAGIANGSYLLSLETGTGPAVRQPHFIVQD